VITLNKNCYIIYNIIILSYRTNISLRIFIFHALKYASLTYLPTVNGNEVKFGTILKDNLYLQRIRVKFSDDQETNYICGIQVYLVVEYVVAISPWAVNNIPSRCGGDDV